jgi:hypothetical protein
MNHKPLPPPSEAASFEAGYLASTYRARREFTWAQRAAIVSVLTGAAPDPRVATPATPQPSLRSFALILARCESAATLLGWRKQITPEQKRRLDAAVQRLQDAVAQVAVCAPAPPAAARRARSRLFRQPFEPLGHHYNIR